MNKTGDGSFASFLVKLVSLFPFVREDKIEFWVPGSNVNDSYNVASDS